MTPRSILVASDLTLAAANATWRAAQLARQHGATLRLLQVASDSRKAQAAQSALERLAASIQQRLGVIAEVAVAGSDLQRETGRAASGADLLVVPARDGRTWRERLAGTTTERLVRASRIPVLVVKRSLPRARSMDSHGHHDEIYARVLACVGGGPVSTRVIAAAAALATQSQIEVFHALSLERTSSDPHIGGTREGSASTIVDRAREAMHERIAQAGAQRHAVPGIGFGPAGTSVLARERAIGADLVVLGKRHSRLLGDFFLGAIAQEVLSGARCDVLVVPTMSHPPPAMSETAGEHSSSRA